MIPLLCCCICTATYGCGSVKLYKKVKRDRFQDQMVKDFESALDQKVSAVRGSQQPQYVQQPYYYVMQQPYMMAQGMPQTNNLQGYAMPAMIPMQYVQ